MLFWNFRQFQTDLNNFCEKEVPTEFKCRQIEIIIFLFNAIRSRCPVAPDNSQWEGFKGGFALTNWRVSMNTPPSDTVGQYGNPTRLRTTEEIRGQLSTLKQGTKSGQGLFDIIWVFNNVHYIPFIENGCSMQYPWPMVGLALDETRAYIARKGWDYSQVEKETRSTMFRFGYSAKQISSIFNRR